MQEEEKGKIDGILELLDDSGVAEIIEKNSQKGVIGRESYNPCRMFAAVLLAFALGRSSLREMESACRNDLRFIYVLEGECPSHATFSNFINKIMLPSMKEVYASLTSAIFKKCGLSMDTCFLDGTKFEADANRYKFVWKPTKYHENLDAKIRNLLAVMGLDDNIPHDGWLPSSVVRAKIDMADSMPAAAIEDKAWSEKKANLMAYLLKLCEYEEKLWSKKRIKGGRYLYAFKDMEKAHGEANGILDKLSKENRAFEKAVFDKAVDVSGTIVFESDLDAEPLTIYQCYEKRWLLELVFRSYKNDECLDRTRENGDFSVLGSEFVNFIATLITTRLIDRIEKTELLKKMTYAEVMDDLTESWRMVDAPDEAKSDDKYWKNVSEGIFPELEVLGLSIPVEKPAPRRRGRPRTKPLPDPDAPRRKRGRTKKNSIHD